MIDKSHRQGLGANKALERISAVLSIGATSIAAVASLLHFTSIVKIEEVGISVVTGALAAIAGGLSLYIARASKSLPHRRRIFIAYSRDEQDRARALRDLLAVEGARVWLDETALQPGADLQSSIAAAIESSNTVVAIISSNYGASLDSELRTALDRHVPIVALLADKDATTRLRGQDKIQIMEPGTDLKTLASAALAAR